MNDDDDTPRAEDPDRQAILARRRLFVALTLSTLSTGAIACRPRPQPCLRLAPEADMRCDTDEPRTDAAQTTPPPGGCSDNGGDAFLPRTQCRGVSKPQLR